MNLTTKLIFCKHEPHDYSTPLGIKQGLDIDVDCEIKDARELPSNDINKTGFTKINHTSKMAKEDYWDKNKIINFAYKEFGNIPIDQFNAHLTVTYQTRVRTDDPDKKLVSFRGADKIFPRVHSDFIPETEEHGKSMLRAFLGVTPRPGKDSMKNHAYFAYLKDTINYHMCTSAQCPSLDGDLHEMIDNSSIKIYQYWRNLGPKTMTSQLSIADASTLDLESRVENKFQMYAPGLIQFYHHLNHYRYYKNKEHTEIYNLPEFYYYPELTDDELIIMKGFDAEIYHCGGQAWTTPHAAFITPNGSNLPSRWSVDSRSWAIWFN